MFKAKKLFGILVVVFVITLMATYTNASAYDGSWSGTTNDGIRISFKVAGDAVTEFDVPLSSYGGGTCSPTDNYVFTPGVGISGGKFSFNVGSPTTWELSVTGSFSSSSTASGTWNFGETYAFCGKGITKSGTWSASSGNSNPVNLVIAPSGTGSGTVTSSDGKINCGSVCSASYTPPIATTLTATPGIGSTFAGWSGAGCSGTGTCTLTSNTSITVTATFTSSGSSDNTTASKWINAVYNQYSSFFGTPSGSITAYTSGSATYYIQWFTNGSAIVAWTDGYIYTYYNGISYALGVAWSNIARAAAEITAIYNQYSSFFGTPSGSIAAYTSGSATYYIQWFTNGSAIVAWTDGYIYTYYNGTSYALAISWK
ncbi:MAG: hypothetical protein HQK95_00340 [Nitrospirae bacterium]|nr:hypothetical protein [Nitrospirota bacterium]